MIDGRCAIITGATKGIGRAIAISLAKDGVNIVINYNRSIDDAKSLKSELDSLGVESILIKADVSKSDEAEEMIKTAKSHFGKIDILVNNAGIVKDSLILRMKQEDFDTVLDVNLKGTFNCIRFISPIMLKQKFGKIINISSVVGICGNAGQVNYSASKAGVIGMTKSLAKELGSRNIQVNAVAPGYICTDMTSKLGDTRRAEMEQLIPLRKLGQPEDVANLVKFLSSKDSDYITGQVINVDGGMVM